MITHVIDVPYKSKNLKTFYNSQAQSWEDILKLIIFYYFKNFFRFFYVKNVFSASILDA